MNPSGGVFMCVWADLHVVLISFLSSSIDFVKRHRAWLLVCLVVSPLCDRANAAVSKSASVVMLIVDGRDPTASDVRNAGKNSSRPFATIGKALSLAAENLHDGRAVTISIRAGIYAEDCSLMVPRNDRSMVETPLVIEGDPAGGTVLDGLKTAGFEATTWRAVPGELGLYEHDWTEAHGLDYSNDAANRVGRFPKGTGLRSESLYVDDQRWEAKELEQYRWVDADGPVKKTSAKSNGNQAGKFNYAGVVSGGPRNLTPQTYGVIDDVGAPAEWRRRIFLRLAPGKTMRDVRSIAVGRSLPDDALLKIANKNNLVIRNLTIRRASSHLLSGALVLRDCQQVVLTNCDISDNYGCGASVTVERMTIERCRFERNGGKGLGRKFDDSRIVDSAFNFNCWRAVAADFLGYDTAGIKIGQGTRNARVIRCIAVGNGDSGFWHDVACTLIRYEQCFSYANARAGFFFENSAQPNSLGEDVIDGCVSIGNSDGVMLSDVRRPSVLNCLIVDNSVGIRIRETPRVPNLRAEFGYTRIIGNTISSADGQSLIWVMTPGEMMPTLECRKNRYITSKPSDAFIFGKSHAGLPPWKQALAVNASAAARDGDASFETIEDGLKPFVENSELARQISAMRVPLPWDVIRRAVSSRVKANESSDTAPMDHLKPSKKK